MKKNYFSCLFAFFTMALVGCKHDTFLLSNQKEVDYSVSSDKILEGEHVDIDILGLQRIFVGDNYMVLFANDSRGMIKVFDLDSLIFLGTFCPEGRARTDLLNPDWSNLQLKKENGSLLLYVSGYSGEMKVINISESVANNKTIVENTYNTISAYTGYSLYLSDNCWVDFENVSYDDPRDHIYYPPRFYVRNSKERDEIPLFGDIIKPEIPSLTTNIYSGVMALKPDNTKCVYAMTILNYLHIFDLQNKSVTSMHQFDGGSLYGPTTVDYYNNISFAFYDLVTTDTRILALSYDQSNMTMETEGIQLPSLKIFDWDGNFITGVKLDTFIRWFAYDEIHKCLYGLNDIDEEIIKYNISNLLD